jgi:thioredoxin reductase
MAKSGPPRVAVIGAGPAGLEAAAYAHALGWPVAVYEQGTPGAHVERWGFAKMFTPFGLNVSPLGRRLILRENPRHEFPADAAQLTGSEYRAAYLTPLAATAALGPCLRPDSRVLAVGRAGWRKTDPLPDRRKPLPPFKLLVRDGQGAERFEAADAVLDCTGVLGRPNWLGDGGIPAAGEVAARPHFAYGVDDVLGAKSAHYAGKTVAVVGAGHSAATVVCDLTALAEQYQATWVVWLTHGPKTSPLPRLENDPLKERDRLAARANHLAARCDGNLEYHAQCRIDECSHLPGVANQPPADRGFRLTGTVAGEAKTWEVERVVAATGYRPDMSLCSELRVSEPAGETETAEPGYFFLGAKSAGRASSFLIRDAHEQVRRTFATLAGQPRLNQYAA